jgi:chaperone required for assembly of F1-ATPase
MQREAKRFYRHAAVALADGGFSILLGSRPVRTPAGVTLIVPTAALAAAVANEWLAQGETLRPERMPLTRLAVTALDRTRPRRDAVIRALMEYVETDMVCYRAAEPVDLVALQTTLWQPLVEWLATEHGARLQVCTGVVPVAQPAAAVAALRAVVEATSDRQLTALATAVPASGSLVIGLALLQGHLNADAAIRAALLDEQWQADRWGVDAEAEARRSAIADDVRAAGLFLLLAGEAGSNPALAEEAVCAREFATAKA